MSIRLITVDMNGTFLNDQKTYNRERFMAQYRQMKEQGVRSVVASGNQYYQLISFFPKLANGISSVAENGGWVVGEGKNVLNGELVKDDFHAIVDHLLTRADVDIIVCGKNSVYMLKQHNGKHKNASATHCHRLESVDNFDNFNDVFFKFGLSISNDRIPQVQADLHEVIGDIMVPVHTGYDNISLITPDVHKTSDLHLLQQRWNINDSEVIMLGDGGDGIEILCQAGFSLVMANIHEPMIEAIRYRANSNSEEGALDIIDRVLKNEVSFTH